MKAGKILLVVTLMAVLITWGFSAQADFGDIIKRAKKAIGLSGGGLSEGRIIEGLKEALQIGTGNAVGKVSQVGGALDGLFLMLAEEEKKIRQDPAARVTDLLKEVFGKD